MVVAASGTGVVVHRIHVGELVVVSKFDVVVLVVVVVAGVK